jgi:hypothetical protein
MFGSPRRAGWSLWHVYACLAVVTCVTVIVVERLNPPKPLPEWKPPTDPRRGVATGVWKQTTTGGPGIEPYTYTKPVTQARLKIVTADTGRIITEVRTDKEGRFRVELPPGRYQARYTDFHPGTGKEYYAHGDAFEVIEGTEAHTSIHTWRHVP